MVRGDRLCRVRSGGEAGVHSRQWGDNRTRRPGETVSSTFLMSTPPPLRNIHCVSSAYNEPNQPRKNAVVSQLPTDSVIRSGDTDRLTLERHHRKVAVRVVIHRMAVQDSARHCQLAASPRNKVEERELCSVELNLAKENQDRDLVLVQIIMIIGKSGRGKSGGGTLPLRACPYHRLYPVVR